MFPSAVARRGCRRAGLISECVQVLWTVRRLYTESAKIERARSDLGLKMKLTKMFLDACVRGAGAGARVCGGRPRASVCFVSGVWVSRRAWPVRRCRGST